MSLFQNEAKYEAIDVKMIFCSHADKTYFHGKRFRSQLHFKSESSWNSQMACLELVFKLVYSQLACK